MNKKKVNLQRRKLLKALGSSAIATPFTAGLLEKVAWAQSGQTPLRFVMMFTGNEQRNHLWLPTGGGGGDFVLAPGLSPLETVRNKIMLIHGLQGVNGHSGGMSETTTGRPAKDGSGVAAGGPSIDQFLAELWQGQTPLASLELGVNPGTSQFDQICYSSRGMPIPAIGSPLGGYDKLVSVTNVDPETALKKRTEESHILTSLRRDYANLRGKLPRESQLLLEEFESLVAKKEGELASPYEPLECELPSAPTGSGLEATWDAHMDTIVAALRCGSTRVASLRVGGWGGCDGYSEIGTSNAHHAIAHGGGGASDYETISRFHAEQFRKLVAALDSIQETASTTLLDHTVVVWFSELGLGVANNHGRADVPIVMAGGKEAGFAQQLYVNLGGTDYQNFLYTLASILSNGGVSSFGERGTSFLSSLVQS